MRKMTSFQPGPLLCDAPGEKKEIGSGEERGEAMPEVRLPDL